MQSIPYKNQEWITSFIYGLTATIIHFSLYFYPKALFNAEAYFIEQIYIFFLLPPTRCTFDQGTLLQLNVSPPEFGTQSLPFWPSAQASVSPPRPAHSLEPSLIWFFVSLSKSHDAIQICVRASVKEKTWI